MSASEEKKQEYLDVISRALENIEGSEEGFQQINSSASTLCDVNQVMNYNPNMSVVRNNGGAVIGYDYKYTGPKKPDTDSLTVNSNNDTGYYGTVDAITGADPHVAFKPLDDPRFPTTVSGGIVSDVVNKLGDFTSGMISTGYALAAGIAKFGKNVADVGTQYLAALNQDYEVNFGDLLTVSGNSQGTANALRVLFGLDPLGNVTMYMDEDNLGAIGILLRDNHFFDKGDESIIAKPTGATGTSYSANPPPIPFIEMTASNINPFINSNQSWANSYAYCFDYTYTYGNVLVYFLTNTQNAKVRAVTVSDYNYTVFTSNVSGISIQMVYAYASTPTVPSNYFGIGGMSSTTDNLGNTAYYKWTGTASGWVNGGFPKYTPRMSGYVNGIALMLWYGQVKSESPVEGITDQPGATDMVDAITGADPHVVGQNLYNQYPQVMGEPLLVNVMDDSCNQVTNRYFSVPLTYSPTNLNVNAPVNATLQLDPSFNPDLSVDLNPTVDIDIDKLIDQIILQLQGSGAGRDVVQVVTDPDDPTQDPEDVTVVLPQPTIPNTGSGVTPETELPQTDVHGMWHVYNPSSAEVSALGSWLWTTSIIEQIARMFNDPTNSIIGLHAIYGEPHVTSPASIVVGNLTSTVSARVVSSQYTQVDCGSVWLTEFFGNVFDYAPFTEVSIFLPFIGIVSLDVADVMRAQIQVVYNVDVYTGACIAQVSVTRDGVGGVVYQYAGNCAISYPVSSISYNNIFSSMVSVAGGIAALAAGAGPLGIAMNVTSALGQAGRANVSRSGSFSANAGAMGSKKPYLIIRRPQPNMAFDFEKYDGHGSNFTSMLNQCAGYTKCKEVHLSVPGAYKEELDEIEQLLKEGIILPA